MGGSGCRSVWLTVCITSNLLAMHMRLIHANCTMNLTAICCQKACVNAPCSVRMPSSPMHGPLMHSGTEPLAPVHVHVSNSGAGGPQYRPTLFTLQPGGSGVHEDESSDHDPTLSAMSTFMLKRLYEDRLRVVEIHCRHGSIKCSVCSSRAPTSPLTATGVNVNVSHVLAISA